MATIELGPGRQDVLLELLAARDRADYGEADFTRSLLLVSWPAEEFTLETDSVLAISAGEPLGGVVLLPPGALGFVAPHAEGRGAGSRLLDWVQQRAAVRGRDTHRQRAAAGNRSAHSLLTGRGYALVREVRHMSLDLEGGITAPDPPAGIMLSRVDPVADARALHEADGRMFAGNADYEPVSFAAFHEAHLGQPGFAPDLSSMARSGDQVVAFTLCSRADHGVGVVDLLAVDPAHRRRGLGRTLLLEALRAFAAAGLREGRLDVASDNPPALSLYAGVGMMAARRTHVFEKPLSRA
jgi:mycothiol synthase